MPVFFQLSSFRDVFVWLTYLRNRFIPLGFWMLFSNVSHGLVSIFVLLYCHNSHCLFDVTILLVKT